MFYKCPDCDCINNSEAWNESTIKEFGGEVVRINECETGFYFICPSCNKWIRRKEMIETKNKRDIMKFNLLKLAN